ncbi:MAG: putative avirulence protein [Marinobacter excellens HL-55]|uniref:Putative avirulence protein n=1 Tax=Marinobacter excellens HL-55 TaxID=1305731 RepID=A0A0P8BB03_9GAMM|nr:MAG: putative avirulence protein [Marinobacter excellens HL-55]
MTTTTADSVTGKDSPNPEQVRRGRRTALLLFAVGFGPMVLATIMFYTGWLNPMGHTNQGELIMPPVPVQAFNLETSEGEPLVQRFGVDKVDPNWLMLVVAGPCGGDCEQLLYLSRQVNIALGKYAPRVSRAAALGSVPASLDQRWSAEYSSMERLQHVRGTTPAWPAGVVPDDAPRILLVDPFGNVMMHYGVEHSGKQLLKDLKQLLKLSQIG